MNMIIYSQFQQQFPLSPRKFWKKMFSDLVGFIVISIIIFIVAVLIAGALVSGSTQDSTYPTDPIVGWIRTIAVVIVAILLVYLALKALYIKAYIKRYYYDCNENFVTIKKGVFGPTEIHVQYAKIQDVYVDQDILDRIMGLYDVHIASATVTSGIEAHIDGVDRQAADGIKNFLLEKIKTGGSSQAGGFDGASLSQNSQTPINPQIKFDHPITSAEYPMQGRWLVSAAISSLLSSLFILIVISFLLTASSSVGAIIYLFIYFIFSIASFFWRWAWKNSYHFEFTPEYILLRDGVISKEERHLPYKSIQNVTLKQGVIDRMLGIGSVSIENAASQGYAGNQYAAAAAMRGGILIPGQSIDKANELLGILNDIVSKNANPAGMGL